MKNNGKWSAKAEMILMGMMQPVSNAEEAIYIIEYILKVLDNETTVTGLDVFNDAHKYCDDGIIQYIHVGTVCGMKMIALPMTTAEDTEPFDIVNPDGVFGYVYNVDDPQCSELGYTFFKKLATGGRITRLG